MTASSLVLCSPSPVFSPLPHPSVALAMSFITHWFGLCMVQKPSFWPKRLIFHRPHPHPSFASILPTVTHLRFHLVELLSSICLTSFPNQPEPCDLFLCCYVRRVLTPSSPGLFAHQPASWSCISPVSLPHHSCTHAVKCYLT